MITKDVRFALQRIKHNETITVLSKAVGRITRVILFLVLRDSGMLF